MGFQVHQQVPLYVGSTEEVEKLEQYLAYLYKHQKRNCKEDFS
jgi:hypothetical protein